MFAQASTKRRLYESSAQCIHVARSIKEIEKICLRMQNSAKRPERRELLKIKSSQAIRGFLSCEKKLIEKEVLNILSHFMTSCTTQRRMFRSRESQIAL